ncbi:hypothetical protein KGM_212028 [Danaus plexippus plexippus]|uniref:Uncharacterized protein n=1 Tax=Danaus plexippus plexippus TaxID=278856 RepID=A0A212F7S0_DANPL|nr:hypothetical protein KGM_212028 [Danaus plexippus plexippus]
MEHPGGFASPWAAMLGHGMHGMMQHEYAQHAHASMPMDLHVPQAFPYYRNLQQMTLMRLVTDWWCVDDKFQRIYHINIQE